MMMALGRRDVLCFGLKLSLFVGTVLVLINHRPCCLTLDRFPDVAHPFQILLTYLAPFGVSLYVSARRDTPYREAPVDGGDL